jgi:HEAT repeat protein
MTRDTADFRSYSAVRVLRNTVPFVSALLFFTGCLPEPIAHKKVKRRPPDTNLATSRLGYTSVPVPAGFRDEQVMPAVLAVPTFEQRSEQQVASEALSQIGPQAIPELRRALQSSEARARREAAGVLARMGPEAKEAVPDLIRLLDDEDEATRKMASLALGRIGPDAAPAVPALMRTLLEPKSVAPIAPRP